MTEGPLTHHLMLARELTDGRTEGLLIAAEEMAHQDIDD